MLLASVVKFLEKNYPPKNAEDWDFSGLVLGNPRKKVQKIMVCLDLTTNVLEHVVDNQVDLIITHHPFIFNELTDEGLKDEFQKYTYKKRIFNRLQNTKIALYTCHTNYDSSKNGTVDNLLATLELRGVKIANSPFGKMVNTPMNTKKLKHLLFQKLNINNCLVNKKEDFVTSQVAFLPGSGSVKDLVAARKQGAGIIVTSDIKWSMWLWAEEENVCLFEITHSVEKVFESYLATLLKAKFKGTKVLNWNTCPIAKVY